MIKLFTLIFYLCLKKLRGSSFTKTSDTTQKLGSNTLAYQYFELMSYLRLMIRCHLNRLSKHPHALSDQLLKNVRSS